MDILQMPTFFFSILHKVLLRVGNIVRTGQRLCFQTEEDVMRFLSCPKETNIVGQKSHVQAASTLIIVLLKPAIVTEFNADMTK